MLREIKSIGPIRRFAEKPQKAQGQDADPNAISDVKETNTPEQERSVLDTICQLSHALQRTHKPLVMEKDGARD